MYKWAEIIKPLQRDIDLLFRICGQIEDSQKIIIMAFIHEKQEQLTDIQTLSTYSMTIKQNMKEREDRKLSNTQRIERRITKLQADAAMYRATRNILVGYNNMLSPTDRRINKKMYNSCRGMAFTCDILQDIN